MDFRDVRCGMCQVRDGLTGSLRALEACGYGFWETVPESSYGPGELIVHIAQVARFTQGFVHDQLGLPGAPQFEVPDKLRPAIHNLPELRRVNLASARESFDRFKQFEDFRVWAVRKCRGIYDWTSALPDSKAQQRVSHPLVVMECGAATMLYRQFVVHTAYHLGQLTQQMKDAGFADRIPHLELFGSFPKSEAA